jgi:hypothetical protein
MPLTTLNPNTALIVNGMTDIREEAHQSSIRNVLSSRW